jgi:hypothetical protein
MNTEKGANHCQQNSDPLDENNDFTLVVENSDLADFAAHRDCFCGGSRSRCSKGSSRGHWTRCVCQGNKVPLGTHRMSPECLDFDRSSSSIAVTILLREEPDEEEEEEEEDRNEEDDDGDEGYSE